MTEDVTLTQEMRTIGDDEMNNEIRNKLIVIHMLANVQMNLMDDIKRSLDEKGKYRYTIKHNLKDIQRLIRKNATSKVFDGFDEETMDLYMMDYEELEGIIYDWINNDSNAKEINNQ